MKSVAAVWRFILVISVLAVATPYAPLKASIPVSPTAIDTLMNEAASNMLGNPALAFRQGEEARKMAGGLPTSRGTELKTAKSLWLQGEAAVRMHRADRAKVYVEQGLSIISRIDPESKLRGDLLTSRGWLRFDSGDTAGALADYQNAYAVYKRLNDGRGQSKAMMLIASLYNNANDFPRAIRYYAQALEIYRGDPQILISLHNNLANALSEAHLFKQAEFHFEVALSLAEKNRASFSEQLCSRILLVQN